jgi:transposase
MAVAYSQDLRDRVMAARERGIKTKQVGDLFAVSSSWVRRVMQRKRECGQTAPRPRGGITVIKIDLERLSELVRQQPDATVRELHERLGIDCSVSAVDMALRRLGLSFKKRRSMRPSKTAPTSPSSVCNGAVSSRVRRQDD